MTSRPLTQRIAEWLIGRAGRHLPAAAGMGGTGNGRPSSPAILADPDVRPVLRQVRALRFAGGTIRTAPRREHGIFRGQLTGADARAAGVRLFLSASLWLAAICVVRIGAVLKIPAPHGIWIAPIFLAGAAIDLFAMAQLIKLVRWLCQPD